jgi:hypothetical protein
MQCSCKTKLGHAGGDVEVDVSSGEDSDRAAASHGISQTSVLLYFHEEFGLGCGW